ncbi:BspA family leucine-rich repeat surface protein [Leuconostoc falkenbergense]|uniref:BspA family leucine-rich repeat surface protein n=1 Tax=Leuconostoc falkenbergense TaxID=2766470 RepID=UPI0021AA9370|nr:BspA family leucine-rich repeat surface protein [Leuconostoc falkenbergense]
MRLKQQLTLIILITILTLTGPVQAVTASQLADHDDGNTTTKMRLPNEGRSDLQELIQRVDANVGEPSSEEPSSDPEPDEPETVEGPVEDSGVSAPESKEAEATDDQKAVVQAKAPRAITTNTNGDSTWTFDSDTGLLVFGAGTLAERIDNNLTSAGVTPADVTSIQFESGVVASTAVTYLFANLTQLSEFIDLNNFNTSSVANMTGWFSSSGSSLAELDLSNFNVDCVTNFNSMFSSSTFKGLNLSNWGEQRQATNVSLNSMFSSCKSTLNLTNFQIENVTNMSYMFAYYSNLTLNLSNWDVSHVSNVSGMFMTSSIANINLTNWHIGDDAQNVNMSGMFAFYSGELNLTGWSVTNVNNMSGVFSYSSGIESLDLNNWDVSQVTNFANMFAGSKIKQLEIADWHVNTSNDFTYMFDTSDIEQLDISQWNMTAGATTTNMFGNMKKLWQIKLGSGVQFNGDPAFRVAPPIGTIIYDKGRPYVVSEANWKVVGTGNVHEPMGGTITTTQMAQNPTQEVTYVWAQGSEMTGVNGNSPWTLNLITGVLSFKQAVDSSSTKLAEPIFENINRNTVYENDYGFAESITKIEFTVPISAPDSAAGLFANLSELETLDVTDLDTSDVTDMQGMFSDMSKLKSLNLSHFDTSQVTNMAFMFASMQSLKSITFGENFDTSQVEDMNLMFAMTPALESLDVSHFNTSKVTNMMGMFAITGIKKLDLSNFDTNQVKDMWAMFFSAERLETLDISSFDTSGLDEATEDYSPVQMMFEGTTNLWQIKLGPNTVLSQDPSFVAAPAAGTAIPGTSYVTNDETWQIVGNGTVNNPSGAKVTTDQMWGEDATRPVTYVWAHQAPIEIPTIDSVSNITFGTLGASDFFNGNSPLATNMATGSVALKDLDNITTYNVTVAQTSDWTTDGESATIAKSNLKIKYGANDLSTSASSFWSGTSATATKNIAFNHDDTKNFSIWLNPSTVLNTALLGKQLESELTWTLSETP